ncbi:MAG TPA: Smr/MutS family protein [Pyrinomonadaceae bacterium]|nr:Smr/MutS family protein [Pyrinomonadaceae bacterium]
MTVGSKVVTSFGNVGTVEKIDKENAEVQVGGIRLREKVANLRLADQQAETRPVGRVSPTSVTKPIDSPDAAAELNLIGKTTAEAEYELDRFIDEAYMASLAQVRIIHGFGTGALKNYVHHFLKNHELVERFGFAPDSQGGHGATVAEIKL